MIFQLCPLEGAPRKGGAQAGWHVKFFSRLECECEGKQSIRVEAYSAIEVQVSGNLPRRFFWLLNFLQLDREWAELPFGGHLFGEYFFFQTFSIRLDMIFREKNEFGAECSYEAKFIFKICTKRQNQNKGKKKQKNACERD